jgi:type I restriction enzyme, S subunit
MAQCWQAVPLKKLLKRIKEDVALDDSVLYKQVTVRLWSKGITLRGEKLGIEIKTKRQFLVRTGQLLLSRIDVRNGAIGLVPAELDEAIVSNDFWVYDIDSSKIIPEYLAWYVTTPSFTEQADRTSSGTTKRIRATESALLKIEIHLPSLDEQRRIVTQIETLEKPISKIKRLRESVEDDIQRMLLSAFQKTLDGANYKSMKKVAPIVRRKVLIDFSAEYPELGIRSFGKGTFHKPALAGFDVGSKKLYEIKAGDLMFSNVFSWEGAIAVAKPEDDGRFGSHRFISCVPKPGLALASFLCFYFLTREGLEKIRDASPGGAGRNRTLGLKKLEAIQIPVPDYDKQLWFQSLLDRANQLRLLQAESQTELDALLPSVLDRTFKGAL